MNAAGHQVWRSVAQVQASLAQARDAQIARIVAMVDAMPHRGEADVLIAPLRERLLQLQLHRKLGFTRLLFTPLDTVIVPGERWRPGDVGVPRPALAPIAAAIRRALPEVSAQIDAALEALAPGDQVAIDAAGATLWSNAAALLGSMAAPPDWSAASNLPIAEYASLAAAIRAVLAEASCVESLAASRQLPQDGPIRAVLGRAAKYGGPAAATVTAVLLARLPKAEQVLALAAETAGRWPAESAIDHTLVRLQSAVAAGAAEDGDLTEAALDAARVAALLDGLESSANTARRRQLDQIRRQADMLCVGRFERAMTATIAQTKTLALLGADDRALLTLEEAIRALRRLETAGRRLGSCDEYDAMLNAFSEGVKGADSGFALADRVRLVEILSGPDQALALLASSSS